MKLVLTSGGISNKGIEKELINIVGKDLKNLKLLFCTTASNYEGGVMNDWLVKDLICLDKLGFKIDVCDINGANKEHLLPRFEWADILYFEGGNTQWLRNCIKNSGLEEHLVKLLETRIWVGASAGSCVLSPTVDNPVCDIFDDNVEGYPADGLNLVNFQFIPHFNNKDFPKVSEENIRRVSEKLTKADGEKVYVLDDNSAIFIDNGTMKIISEGNWFEVEVQE